MDFPICRAKDVCRSEMRRGEWVRLHRGIYVPFGEEQTPELRAAAALAAIPESVVSHDTAAALWGIQLVHPSGFDHVTVPKARRRPSWKTLRIHAMDLRAADVTTWRGLPLTTPVRTLEDLARDRDRLSAIWAVEQALAWRMIRPEQLTEVRGARARRWWALAEARSESPLETGIRLVLMDAGLPRPELQIPVRDGAFRIDLGYREQQVGIEADGRAVHGAPEAIYADRVRANALNQLGWRLLRFTWRDLVGRPDYIAGAVRSALYGPAA